MKYLKIIGLAAVAAMALMAFAGSASATVLKKGTTTMVVGEEIHATLATGTSSTLTTDPCSGCGEPITLNTCTESTVKGKITNAGSSTTTVVGSIEKANLTWSKCVSGSVTTIEGGALEVHSIASTTNGTLTAKSFKVTVNTILGPCTYTAGTGTHMGTLTGTSDTTKHATMDIAATVTRVTPDPETGTCPDTAIWKGTYTVTSPTGLNVEAS
jgi:hypothetical protein